MSLVRTLAEKDPAYRPYCLRCRALVRMDLVEPFFWRCGCGAIHDERNPPSGVPTIMVERVGGNVQVLREAKAPDVDGWWARREDGKVTWYRVQVCDDAGPCVYVSEFHEMVPVAKFTHPLTKWYGPVALPWGKDD